MDWSAALPTCGALDAPQLAAYLARLGLSSDEASAADRGSAEQLRRVVVAQAERIPFEMFDITLGRAIDLALPAVVAKLVRGARGGCCLEANGLCAAALAALGFRVALRHARVWLRATVYTPRAPPICTKAAAFLRRVHVGPLGSVALVIMRMHAMEHISCVDLDSRLCD